MVKNIGNHISEENLLIVLAEITIRLDDGILTVTVPKINDSCFDSGDLDE